MAKRKAKPKPLASFRIRPSGRSRLYFTVRVFGSLREMHRWPREGSDVKRMGLGSTFHGMCSTWKYNGAAGAEAGEILLWKKKLGGGIVSHECLHAVFGLMWRRGMKLDLMQAGKRGLIVGNEETACQWLGYLVKETYNGLYARKLVTP